MQEPNLVEWLNSPETKMLLAFLRRRKAGPVAAFLRGEPWDPMQQARAVAYHEIETLLTLPADAVQKELNDALKERKK